MVVVADHKHSNSCYKTTLSCTTMPHSHSGGACFAKDGSLKCGKSEHSHSGSCYSPVGPLCGHL